MTKQKQKRKVWQAYKTDLNTIIHNCKAMATSTSLSLFICPRCEYTNKCFTVFMKHLNRKKQCAVLSGKDDIDPVAYGAQLSDTRYSKKRHPCDECGKKYTTPASLRMHKIRKHGLLVALPSSGIDMDEEVGRILDDVFGDMDVPAPVPHPFGQEDIGHLLHDTVPPQLLQIFKDESLVTMDDRFAAVVDMVYNDPMRPCNRTYKAGDDGNVLVWRDGDYRPPKSMSAALKVIKQRANTVMQNPLSFDDEPLAAFVKEVGEERYDELKEYTYKLDLLEDAEFDARTDAICACMGKIEKQSSAGASPAASWIPDGIR